MPDCERKRPITIVSACMTVSGLPAFAVSEVEVTPEEAENGVQYYLAEAHLLESGYEEPMVHFSDGEAPDFLLPAVKQHLAAAA